MRRDELLDSKKLTVTLRELAKLGYNYAEKITQVESFGIFHLKEPYLSIGREKILYPLEFRDVKQFYTSDVSLHVNIKPYVADSQGRYILDKIKEQVSRYSRRYNFYVNFDSTVYSNNIDDSIASISEYMKSISRSNRQSNHVVVLIARKLNENRYNLIKAQGIRYMIPTHIINLDKVDEIRRYCKSERCPGLIVYLLNNYVQLYAKAGGIPWTVGDKDSWMLRDTLIIGLAVSRIGNTGYLAGVSYALAYMGKEVRSYVYSEFFKESELDLGFLKTRGLYIPAGVVKSILSHIKDEFSTWNINRYIIFQTTVIHPDEVKGVTDVLGNNRWILSHIKDSGFIKRIYDLNSHEYSPYRGLCIVDEDSVGSNTFIRALLSSTGLINVKRIDYRTGELVEEEKRTYKQGTTPKPLELRILYGPKSDVLDEKSYIDRGIALYISRLVLLLSKLDWEAYTTWPKLPFVVKYAKRIAKILSLLYQQRGQKSIDFARDIISLLRREPRALRYIM